MTLAILLILLGLALIYAGWTGKSALDILRGNFTGDSNGLPPGTTREAPGAASPVNPGDID